MRQFLLKNKTLIPWLPIIGIYLTIISFVFYDTDCIPIWTDPYSDVKVIISAFLQSIYIIALVILYAMMVTV